MERIPMDFTEMFCDVDDFCQKFEPVWRQKQIAQDRRRHRRQRKQRLSLSERMTIIITFHAGCASQFQTFLPSCSALRHRADFPGLVSYTRFVQLMSVVLQERKSLHFISLISTKAQTRFWVATPIRCGSVIFGRSVNWKGSCNPSLLLPVRNLGLRAQERIWAGRRSSNSPNSASKVCEFQKLPRAADPVSATYRQLARIAAAQTPDK